MQLLFELQLVLPAACSSTLPSCVLPALAAWQRLQVQAYLHEGQATAQRDKNDSINHAQGLASWHMPHAHAAGQMQHHSGL